MCRPTKVSPPGIGGEASRGTRRAGWYFRTRAQRASLYFREALLSEKTRMRYRATSKDARCARVLKYHPARLVPRLAAPPIPGGDLLLAHTFSLGLLRQALTRAPPATSKSSPALEPAATAGGVVRIWSPLGYHRYWYRCRIAEHNCLPLS